MLQVAKRSVGPASTALEQVLIVDEHNNPVGATTRQEMRAQNLPHRATFIIIQHPTTSQFYVQKRTMTKDTCPGFFDPCPGGVRQADEPSDLISAEREIEEEMGIAGVELTHQFDDYFESEDNKLWCAVFHCQYEGELVIQEEEVDSMYLKSAEEILGEVEEGVQYSPDSIQVFKKYLAMTKF